MDWLGGAEVGLEILRFNNRKQPVKSEEYLGKKFFLEEHTV